MNDLMISTFSSSGSLINFIKTANGAGLTLTDTYREEESGLACFLSWQFGTFFDAY